MTTLQAFAVAVLTLGLSTADRIPGPSVVEMTRTSTFLPRELTVVVGEVVVWKNNGERPATVNTDPEACKRPESKEWVQVPAGATPFFSGEIKPGAEFYARFEIPGTYRYLCVYHEDQMMRGVVVVAGSEVK